MGRLNPYHYVIFLGLIGLCVLVGSLVIWWLRRDVQEDTPVTEEDVLRDLERAYFEGEMDKSEFDRVTASLKASKVGASKLAKPIAPEVAGLAPGEVGPPTPPPEPKDG